MPIIRTTANGLSQQPPAYMLDGYSAGIPLVDDSGAPIADAGQQLLTLMLTGAHLVTVLDSDHIPPGTQAANLYDNFSATALPKRDDPANSHYLTGVDLYRTSGKYYLSINEDRAPTPCPFLCAILLGPTADLSIPIRDTFLQLEGWQEGRTLGVPSWSGWHNRDYNGLYKRTLWNISTYGASIFSEKRGTTAFLAPPGVVTRDKPTDPYGAVCRFEHRNRTVEVASA